LLWPVAWPSGKLLDAWIGPEGIPWFHERELRRMLEQHARSDDTEISRVEAAGAINFLALDDIPVGQEGEPLDPKSVICLPFRENRPLLPDIRRSADDPFLRQLAASGKKWVVFVDARDEPHLVADAPALLREALFGVAGFDPYAFCHHPLVVRNASLPLGQVLSRFTVQPEKPGDDVIDEDLILVWVDGARRIITGSDLLGRLLRSIAHPAGAVTRVKPETQPPGVGSPQKVS
jgi:metal transporter CNNM